METIIYKLPDPKQAEYLEHAADILRRGGLVAFPTETVYGLGASYAHPSAIRRIFEVKGRPNDNPLILHIARKDVLSGIAHNITEQVWKLTERFWPGPLTLVLPACEHVPPEVTAGLPTVAVRMPNHPVALELLQRVEDPVAAPSANLSGRPSPTTGSDVVEDLSGSVDMILDAGSAGVGVESTVLDMTGIKPRVLRPGGVTVEMLEGFFGSGEIEASWQVEADRPMAPGMKYRHYAPEAPMKVYLGTPETVRMRIQEAIAQDHALGRRVAVLGFDDAGTVYSDAIFLSLGNRNAPEEAAQRVFGYLRECDRLGVDRVYGELPAAQGIGMAVLNRLWKAAGGEVIEC